MSESLEEGATFCPLHDDWDYAESAWMMWAEAINQAWLIARGMRLGELRGRRVRTFDDRGLHPYSYVWGAIDALGSDEITDWLRDGNRRLGPELLRRAANADAEAEFKRELIANDG